MQRGTDSRRVAVISGASSGIGEATARSLAAAGMDLALLARRRDKIERLSRELSSDNGRALAIETDITDSASVEAAAARVAEDLGGADVLVNNAGQMLLAPFGAERAEETRRMVETNLLGAMTLTSAFLGQLRRNGGDLVNLSSLAGRTASPRMSVYNATKWGMNGWSEALRQELAPDIRVILVEPGAVDTELTSHITDERSKSSIERWYAKAGAIAPSEVAAVIAFAVGLPHHVSLSEIVVRSTNQA
ncbi:MAG: SDR family NAD(P)-dependent oxidoreductase [Solirubrobacterales bacterium]